MALLYKGYAQQKGFGSYLVDVPDPSKKIRDQGLQAMGHMKDAIEWNNKQATRLSNQLIDNANLEAKQNKENFELGQDLNQVIFNQKERNYNDRIQAAKAKQARQEKQWQSILSLTKSGTQLWKAHKAHQEKAGANYGHMLWEEHGIGMKKLNAIQGIEAEIWNDSSAREKELERLGLQGYNEELLQEIRSLSGYKKLAIAKQDARRYAKNRDQYYQDNWNTKVEIPGYGPVDLDSAQGAQVDTVLQLLDQRAREELGDNSPSSKIMASSGSYALLEQARARVRSQKAQTARKDALAERHNDEHIIINDHISNLPDGSVDVGAGIVKAIDYYAGPNPTAEDYRRAKKRVFDALKSGITSGYWDASKFQGAGSHVFKHSSGEVSIDRVFKKEWLSIEDAMVNGTTREYHVANIAIKQKQTEDRKYLADIQDMDYEKLTATDITHMLKIATKNNWNDSRTFLSNQLTRMANNQADAEVIATVSDAIRENRHLTSSEIRELGGSPLATQQAINMMNENSKFLPDKYGHADRIDDQLEAWLEVQIPTPMTGKQDGTRSAAKDAILTKTRAQYKAFMTKPGATPEAALDHALSYAKEQIFQTDDFKPQFDNVTGTWGFPIGKIRVGAQELEMDYEALATKVQNDRSAVYNEPLMSPNALRLKSENLNKGIQQELLPRSVFIESASAGTVRALETEMAQIEYLNKKLKAEGKPLIRQYPKWYVKQVEDTYKKVNTDVIRLLNKHDYCKVNQAMCTSGNNPVYTRPAFEKSRNIVRATLGTHERGDFNATEGKSSMERADLKNIHLTNASIAEITTLQERGLLQTAGRYQFNVEELLQAAELAKIPLSTVFDADTQNKLFDAYFKVNGPTMIQPMESPEDALLLQDLHESVTTEKLSNMRFNSPRTLSVAAYKELTRRGYYAA